MSKRVSAAAAAVILGLALATLTVTPAQAASDWASVKAGLEAATVGATVTMPGVAIVGTAGDATIAVSTNKTLTVTGASSITTLFASTVISVASGATLTINGGGTLTVTAAANQSIFAGAGTVVLSAGTLTSASTTNVYSGSGAFTTSAGTALNLGKDLTTGSGAVTLNGSASASGAVTFPSGSNLTVGSTGSLDVTGNITVGTGVIVNNAGSISTDANIVNSGKIRFSGPITVNGSSPLINNGTLVPIGGVAWSAPGVDGNNWVVLFDGDPFLPRSIFAKDFDDAEQTLPWNTAWTNFMGWTVGTTTILGATDFHGVAASTVFTMSASYGVFGTGAPVVGVPLTGYTGGLPSSVYTWSLDGTAIATGSTFTPTAIQVGGLLTLNVHTTLQGYDPASSDFDKSFGVVTATFATTPPTVSGLAAVGSTLVADGSGSFTPGATTTTYEWFSNGTSVSTGANYVLQATDVGNTVKVVASGTKVNYVPATAEKIVGTIAAQPIVTLGSTTPTEGDTITIFVPGLSPSTDYRIELHSTPVVLTMFHTSPAGLLAGSITIPLGTAAGAHSIVLFDPNGNPVTSGALSARALPAAAALAATGQAVLVGGWGASGLLVIGLLLLLGRRRVAPRA